MSLTPTFPRFSRFSASVALCATPAVMIFVSSNFVNVGNLAFNMVFSRWMGPELFGDLAVVLTIKLALLGVLGALQMAVSQMVAGDDATERAHTDQALTRINVYSFWALGLALPLVAAGLYLGSAATHLELGSPFLLFIMLGSLPFCAPLNVLRGVALGRMNSNKIVLSANAEMAVRLGLGTLAWLAGFGIEGVVAAIGLSIIVGWAVLVDLLPTPSLPKPQIGQVAATLGFTALPFAVLQVAQIVSLDGDIFLATRFLNEFETGYVAALSLFQRIQFFACFALSGVLLASVVAAVREGSSYRSSIGAITVLLTAVSAVVLTLTYLFPQLLISVMVGKDYVAAAPHLSMVAIAAVIFTINYLIATFLVAIGKRSGIAIVAIGAAVQIALMSWALMGPDGDLAAMLFVKTICQLIILVVLLAHLVILKKTA